MDVITHPYPNFNGGLPKPPLKLVYECVITSHIRQRMWLHYNDVIMGPIASQITSLTIVFSTAYSDTEQRKQRKSSPSLAFVRGIHRGLPRTNGRYRGKCFHLMTSSWHIYAFSRDGYIVRRSHGSTIKAMPGITTVEIEIIFQGWHENWISASLNIYIYIICITCIHTAFLFIVADW